MTRRLKLLDLNNLTSDQNKLFRNILKNERNSYNNLIKRLVLRYPESISWHFSATNSRNTYQSEIYMRCCQMVFIEKIVNTYPDIEKIKIDSSILIKILRKKYSESHQNISFELTKSIRERLLSYVYTVIKMVFTIYRLFKNLFISRVTRPVDYLKFNSPITLLDTFILNNSFENKYSKYNDRYYTGFLDYLEEEERSQVYYLPHFLRLTNSWYTFKNLRGAGVNFLIKEDFLKISDYLKVLWEGLRTLKRTYALNQSQCDFRGINIKPLLLRECWSSFINYSTCSGCLNYHFTKRLSSKSIKVKLVIDWNENQSIDKGLIKGIKDYYPGVPIIGYQGFFIDPNYHIYLPPTDYEFELGYVPTKTIVMGNGLIEQPREFCKKVNVEVGPSGRFQSMWDDVKPKIKTENYVILLPLPISLVESSNILESVNLAIKDICFENLRVIVRQHPTLNEEVIVNLLGDSWPSVFEFQPGNFTDVLSKTDIVIGSTSSVCTEALAHGVPVLIIANKSGLTQNPIPDFVNPKIWKMCFNPDDIRNGICHFYDMDHKEIAALRKICKQQKNRLFTKVTKARVRNLFILPEKNKFNN